MCDIINARDLEINKLNNNINTELNKVNELYNIIFIKNEAYIKLEDENKYIKESYYYTLKKMKKMDDNNKNNIYYFVGITLFMTCYIFYK